MPDDNIPLWVYKAVTGFVAFVSGVWIKSWIDKYGLKSGKDRKKDGNYLVINESMIDRIVTAFEDHTSTMRDIATTLKSHEQEREVNDRMIREIHNHILNKNVNGGVH
jgi:hypothetical protein